VSVVNTHLDGTAELSDAELIGRIRANGPERESAWAELLDRYTPKLFGVARSFDLDSATAEDLVQTTWLRFLERSNQLRDASSVGPWLCMIVRNEARRLVTRRRIVPIAEGWERRPADSSSPVAGVVADEEALAVRSAFTKLGHECRQLLRLMIVDPPLSYDEMAVTLDRPRGSLGPTRRRCLDRLRQLLPAGMEIEP